MRNIFPCTYFGFFGYLFCGTIRTILLITGFYNILFPTALTVINTPNRSVRRVIIVFSFAYLLLLLIAFWTILRVRKTHEWFTAYFAGSFPVYTFPFCLKSAFRTQIVPMAGGHFKWPVAFGANSCSHVLFSKAYADR